MDAIFWQAVAAAATIAAVFFMARQDRRAARNELQQSIEKLIADKLDPMNANIQRLDRTLTALSDRVGTVSEDVAYLRGRQERQGGDPSFQS